MGKPYNLFLLLSITQLLNLQIRAKFKSQLNAEPSFLMEEYLTTDLSVLTLY